MVVFLRRRRDARRPAVGERRSEGRARARDRLVACVAYPAASIDRAGRVQHIEGDHFPVGELDGTARERTSIIADLLRGAGFRSRVLDDVRSEIWPRRGATCR